MKHVQIENFRSKSGSLGFNRSNYKGGLRLTSNENYDNRFIKGPIPLKWIIAASKLSGKTLHISMVLWFLKGVNKNYTVKLSGKLIRSFGVSRSTLYRGLNNLEKAGLITVQRKMGQSPMVTIHTDKKESNDEEKIK